MKDPVEEWVKKTAVIFHGTKILPHRTYYTCNKCGIKEEKKMDTEAIMIVENYVAEHLDKSDPEKEFETYIVWKCKALQNWKYLISTDLYDGMYYELTYNGDKKEWYLDAYKKFENRRIAAL